MKNVILILAALTGLSSAVIADETRSDHYLTEDKGFYVGIAYSHLSHDADNESLTTYAELDFPGMMLDVGYKFNPYIAVEARYNFAFSDSDMDDQVTNADFSVLSLFAKPMYPIAPEADIYVLLGYSLTDISYSNAAINVDEGSLSWGVGASYDVTEEFSLFADYTQYYKDTLNGYDHVIDSFNIGVNYKF